MKKILFLFLLMNSCSNADTVFYTKSVKKCIHNLEVMESWLDIDYAEGKISKELADDYYTAINHTKESLKLKYKINRRRLASEK